MDNSRPLVIAFLLAAVIFAGVVGAIVVRGGGLSLDRDRVTERSAPVVASASDPTTAEAASADAMDGALSLAPPTFDIVRVDAAGTAVLAGRGEPGATVSLLANGAPLIDSEVDSRGEWVAIISDPLPVGAVELALLMRTQSGQELRSDQVVVVSIPETRDTRPLVVLGRPGSASEVLQSPLDDDGREFALLAIDYDDAGAVIFSGRARPDAGVRIFANRREVGETRADGIGRWSLVAGSTLPPGRYDLQVDQLDEDGRVTAVLAVPFERATPEALAEVGPRSVVVQPGNSLWRIARRLYGSGWQYTVIYAANTQQVHDPNLIYPGQILNLPEEPDEDAGQG